MISIGTLNNNAVDVMKQVYGYRKQKEIHVVVDAAEVGATKYRNEKIAELLQYKVTIIKGSASEIAKIAGINVVTKGVDSGNIPGAI
ncbi:MAG: hydroxyethylthiazole kinase [Endomicrobium sp.]|nr:hydroxyethylthiazole kinase [Endomicrobium sp.]